MIGKHRNNHYCYKRLILETSVKIIKMRIMRWATDKRWLRESCKDHTTIEYQDVVNEKVGVIEINTKILEYYFCSVSATKHQMGENREKIIFIISRNKRKLPHWFFIQNLILIWKKNASLSFPTTGMLVTIFYNLCRILNISCLICHILRHKDINYAKFSYSNLQLSAYTA